MFLALVITFFRFGAKVSAECEHAQRFGITGGYVLFPLLAYLRGIINLLAFAEF